MTTTDTHGELIGRHILDAVRRDDGRHLVIRHGLEGADVRRERTELWGLSRDGTALVRQTRTRQAPHSQILAVRALDVQDPDRNWKMTLEAMGWDEARPCQIQVLMQRSCDRLNMTTKRCLINESDRFDTISHSSLTKHY